MDDELSKPKDEADSPDEALDLSVLREIDFGPDWGSETTDKKPRHVSARGSGGRNEKKTPRGNRERPRSRSKSAKPPKPREPEHLINFTPVETLFAKLNREMKTSCRTYSLFDLAKLILEKPERFVVHATPVEKPGQEAANYFVTTLDRMPFTAQEDACVHLMNNHGEEFYEIEEREVEPPKGSFSVVHKCGITGELLSPPNYHRYLELIREHHTMRLANVPFEKFQRRITTDNDPDSVAAWLERMKKVSVYLLKNRSEDEPESFETREGLQRFLVTHRFRKLIKKYQKTRFPGVLLTTMPLGTLKHDVEQALEEQRRHPLITANFLRHRFRKMNFAVYKRGSKGITFVCAIKRKLRTHDAVFADSIQALLCFLEENSNVRKSDLIERHLGFGQDGRTKEQEELVRQLARDLRWVVTEGYATEFADGTLVLPPPVAPRRTSAKKSADKGDEATVSETPPCEETEADEETSSGGEELDRREKRTSSESEES
ncbi:MAG: hypothetical protein VCA36_11240 [Opitutales bacterium]